MLLFSLTMDGNHTGTNHCNDNGSHRLKISLIAVVLMMAAEIAKGILSNKLALLVNGRYMLLDALARTDKT
jgi:Co/Zn/Cd efflux system component